MINFMVYILIIKSQADIIMLTCRLLKNESVAINGFWVTHMLVAFDVCYYFDAQEVHNCISRFLCIVHAYIAY